MKILTNFLKRHQVFRKHRDELSTLLTGNFQARKIMAAKKA